MKFGLPFLPVVKMLIQRPGCNFVDWNQTLFHAMKKEHFDTLLDTSSFRFNSDGSFYDPLEKISAASDLTEQVDTSAQLVNGERVEELFFCHCWHKSEKLQGTMYHANDSTPKHVILKTDFRALYDSIRSNEVFAGEVSYRNLYNFDPKSLPRFNLKFIKDDFWANEEEFRLVIVRRKGPENPEYLTVEVDLNTVLHEVIVRHT